MSATAVSRRPTRILIIDDHQATSDSFSLLLSLYDYDTRVAYNGPQGVRLAKEWVPDVVLCDIGLPGLDGYGVAAALRQDPATAQIRLIAFTGYDSEAHRQRCLEAGFERHLVKPVDPGVLLQLLAAQ